MKKVLSIVLVIAMLLSFSVMAFGATGEGAFEAVEAKCCYKENDTIYITLEFENIVDEFKLIMAAYKNDALCSAESFEITYEESVYDLEMEAKGGDKVKLFFWESISGLVPICEIVAEYIPTKYGYLINILEDGGEYEFEMLTDYGEIVSFACADKISIDEEMLEENESVISLLESSAEQANNSYEDEVNEKYHQIVMYSLNEMGEIARIDTVVSNVNKKISYIADDGAYYSPYGYKEYVSRYNSFGDFKVDKNTRVFFAPDNRDDVESYGAYRGSVGTFVNTMSYHVEAYGLSEDNVASVVMVYKEMIDPDKVYTSSSPMMIVNNKVKTAGGEIYIEGYSGKSYSPNHVYVNLEEVGSVTAIGKGDVIRYITNNKSEIIDYSIWYDASDAVQKVPCNDIDSAIQSRILEINATSIKPVVNSPNASFRLQYGTVASLTLGKDGDSICVVPTIKNDGIDMVTEGNGVVLWDVETTIKIFCHDGANGVTEAELTDIKAGETEVVVYSCGGELMAIYIVK